MRVRVGSTPGSLDLLSKLHCADFRCGIQQTVQNLALCLTQGLPLCAAHGMFGAGLIYQGSTPRASAARAR